MRVDYKVGFHEYKSEWVCFEHEATPAGRPSSGGWPARTIPSPTRPRRRSISPTPAGCADQIDHRPHASGEPFERIVDYELGPEARARAGRGPGPLQDDIPF